MKHPDELVVHLASVLNFSIWNASPHTNQDYWDLAQAAIDAVRKWDAEQGNVTVPAQVISTLADCSRWFWEYARHHQEKGAEEKYQRNADRATACDKALLDAMPKENNDGK